MRNGPIRMGASLARKYGSVNAWPFGTQALGGLHDAMRVFADVDGHAWADMSGEAVMIHMGMGDEHTDQSVVSVREAGNRRQQIFVWLSIGSIKRETAVERNTFSLGFDLNARAAGIPGSPMDTDFHGCPFLGSAKGRRMRRPISDLRR